MALDPEVEAMAQLATALEPLPEEAAARVLRWAGERYGTAIQAVDEEDRDARAGLEPSDIGALFAMADLRTDYDRALLAAYWFHQHDDVKSFTAQQINAALKQMGVGISNITHALNRLIGQRPSLVQQLSKSGRSKQARKQYRLTTAGFGAARLLIDPRGREP